MTFAVIIALGMLIKEYIEKYGSRKNHFRLYIEPIVFLYFLKL